MISANGSMTRSFLWCHQGAVGTDQCTKGVQMIWAQSVCDCSVLRQKRKGSIIIIMAHGEEELTLLVRGGAHCAPPYEISL